MMGRGSTTDHEGQEGGSRGMHTDNGGQEGGDRGSKLTTEGRQEWAGSAQRTT